MANTLVVRLKEWQRDSRLLYLKMPRSASLEGVWRLLYLKHGKHFQENVFSTISSDDTSEMMKMIVVKCTRLYNHLLHCMTTRKRWCQLSANFKDAQLRSKQVIGR